MPASILNVQVAQGTFVGYVWVFLVMENEPVVYTMNEYCGEVTPSKNEK